MTRDKNTEKLHEIHSEPLRAYPHIIHTLSFHAAVKLIKLQLKARGEKLVEYSLKDFGRPNRITTEALVAYVKTFRGLDYANNEGIASFLYDEMGFIPKLSPEGNKFRARDGGPAVRGWEFPPLLELRERWETLFGGQWDWHNPDITEWESQPRLLDRSVLE